MEKIVIVGGVAAGATAAAKARRISSTAQITLLEAGADISFANCGLPYYIGGDIESRSKLILQSPESFHAQYNVDVHTHTLVTGIDRENKVVKTRDTRSGELRNFEYTKLILAQGGRPVVPPIPGASLSNVFTLWTLDDMDKISRYISTYNPQSAVVVGGGFIGLEMVEALVKRGIKVSVVEKMPHVMSTMEAEIAGFIQAEMLAFGVEIHTGAEVAEIRHNEVILGNGLSIPSGMVLMSVGVRPNLQLATEAGLATGESGGLLVNSLLQTNDENIFAAGDMIEVEHRILGRKTRIPLAGPANRQGRIAAGNVLGLKQPYAGAQATSVVRVFDAVAGSSGITLKQALDAGIDADAVVVHKEHHTSYYPGAEMVTVLLVYEKKTGIILGGQTAGYQGADKRLDVIALAAATKATIYDLADTDFAYSPPIGTANDALNMAAYAAANKLSGFSYGITSLQLDQLLETKNSVIIDVRDIFSFEKGNVINSVNIPLEMLTGQTQNIPHDRQIILVDETGKKGHQAARLLMGEGFGNVVYVSGGFISIQRYHLAIGFHNLKVTPVEIENKQVENKPEEAQTEKGTAKRTDYNTPVVVDVRTPGEFAHGAVPGAINIPLDELENRFNELGDNPRREITVYCASGARSSYAKQFLQMQGYANVKNGGGIMQMMMQHR